MSALDVSPEKLAAVKELLTKRGVNWAQAEELACKQSPGIWAERRRGFKNAPFHWEWYDLIRTANRLAVIAPREHAKSEVFTINATAWRCIYTPGLWTYVFCSTGDQATAIKARIDMAILETAPWMIDNAVKMTGMNSTYANFSMVTVAGAGKGVRGAHPDVIIGDDVLEEGTSLTAYQRKKIASWWFGSIGGMAHPVTTRAVGPNMRLTFPPTKVFLVGTPFHQSDLLMGMKENPMYSYRRYAAEYDPSMQPLAGSVAVEAN